MATQIPNFFIVGAPKCGTTSLHAYLNQHPDVFLSVPKEPQFFAYAFGNPYGLSTENPYARDENYASLFEGVRNEKVIGEASTCYSVMSNVPLAIREHNADAKLLAILRDPVQRAWSMYHFWHQFNSDCRHVSVDDFRQRFLADDLLSDPEKRGAKKVGWLRGAGYYWRNLQGFYQQFPSSQIHLVKFDDLITNPQDTLGKICDFLNLDRIQFDASFRENKTVVPRFRRIYNFVNLDVKNPFRLAVQKILGKVISTGKLRKLANNAILKFEQESKLPTAISNEFSSIYRDDLLELMNCTGFDVQSWISK